GWVPGPSREATRHRKIERPQGAPRPRQIGGASRYFSLHRKARRRPHYFEKKYDPALNPNPPSNGHVAPLSRKSPPDDLAARLDGGIARPARAFQRRPCFVRGFARLLSWPALR